MSTMSHSLLSCSAEDALEGVAQLKELAGGESGLAWVCTLAKEWLDTLTATRIS